MIDILDKSPAQLSFILIDHEFVLSFGFHRIRVLYLVVLSTSIDFKFPIFVGKSVPMSKQFLPNSCFQIILFCFLASLFHCDQSLPPLSEKIIEIFQSSQNFQTADQLRYQQDYERAAAQYENYLKATNINLIDSIYLINQINYCHLIINHKDSIRSRLELVEALLASTSNPHPALLADHYFNQGRYYMLVNQRDSAAHYAHQALKRFYQDYPRGHLKGAQTLSLLALIHLKDGNLTDSIHYYSLQANDYFLNNPELSEFDWENDYVLGHSSLLYRAHERGEVYCRAVLKKLEGLPFRNPVLIAMTKNLLGHMIKKQSDSLIDPNVSRLKNRKEQLYNIADSLFLEAIKIGQAIKIDDLLSFYIDWVINSTRFSDSIRFFNAMDAFEDEFKETPFGTPHYNRLLGYYYYDKDQQKSIHFYTRFLEAVENEEVSIYYVYLADCYYSLRSLYRDRNEFTKSAYFAKESFKLYGCLNPEVDINQLNAVSYLDSNNRYSFVIGGFFAEGLLKKYQHNKDFRTLQLANSYFGFIEKHSFRSLLNKDEDAFLTFQLEAGKKNIRKCDYCSL